MSDRAKCFEWKRYEDGVSVNRAGKLAVVIAGALGTGAAVFVASFVIIDFVWTHFVVTDVSQLGTGDGVMVVGGGFIVGTTLGLAALVLMLYRFWPRRTNSPGNETKLQQSDSVEPRTVS
jgi:hypothetical protein